MRFFGKKPEVKQSKVGSLISMSKVGQPVWTDRNYESFAREAYGRNVIAYRCISMIANAVASVEWEVFQGGQKLEKHPLYNLLSRPNPMQSGSELMESIASFYSISGNVYLEAGYASNSTGYNSNPPAWLYSLRPDRMKAIGGNSGMPSAYRYEVGGQHKDFPVARNGKSNILHMRSFNPVNDWYGMADTEAAAYSIDQHNASAAWNQALLQNSAMPSGALVTKGSLDEQQFERLKDQFDSRYASPKNAGKPLLLEGEMEWKQMGTSPKDMDWLEGRREAAREIALGYGVPPMLLGIPGDNTYSNQREARLALWEETILPLLDKITDSFNYWLVPRYGDGIYLTYDMENISALRLRREMQRESLEKATFMTINEKRKAMGMEEIEGGDELFIDSSKIPLGFDYNAPPQTASEAMAKSLKEIGFNKEEIKHAMRSDIFQKEADKEKDSLEIEVKRLSEILEDGK